MLRARVAAVLCLTLGSAGCPTVPEDSDNADCRSADACAAATAPCAGCPLVADFLCLEGSCAPRADDVVEVRGDVSLHRDITGDVVSFVHVLAADTTGYGPFSCADAFEGGRIKSDVNVLAAGYKAVSAGGGAFHEDVGFGRAPDEPLAVLIIATDGNAGQGAVLGTGCLEPAAPSSAPFDVGVIVVAP